MSSRFLALLISALILPLAACASGDDATSTVRHDFGTTRRDPTQALTACHDEPGGVLQVAKDYLQRLLGMLVAANRERTFFGTFAPEELCVNVRDSDAFNGNADPTSRTFWINAGLLRRAGSDAEIAFIIAHELAHITMQHTPDQLPPALAANAEYKALVARRAELGPLMKAVSQRTWAARAAFRDARLALAGQIPAAFTSDWSAAAAQTAAAREALATAMQTIPALELEIQRLRYSGLPEAELRRQIAEKRATVSATLESPLAAEAGAIAAEDQVLTRAAEQLAAAGNAAGSTYLASKQARDAPAAEDVALMREEREVMQRKDEMEEAALGTGTAAVWQEQEADEVGFELFVRARFDPLHAEGVMKRILDLNADQIGGEAALDLCVALLERIRRGEASAPLRDGGSHPDTCFRAYDLGIRELSEHAQGYASFLEGELLTNPLGDALSGVKQALGAPGQ